MLIDKKGVDEVIEILTPEVFYMESNKLNFILEQGRKNKVDDKIVIQSKASR